MKRVRYDCINECKQTDNKAEQETLNTCIVVFPVEGDGPGDGGGCGGWREDDVEEGVVDAREVAGSAGLVLAGLEGEAVDVHVAAGDAHVCIVGLHQAEVAALAGAEPVVAVQDQLAAGHQVLADWLCGVAEDLLSPGEGQTEGGTHMLAAVFLNAPVQRLDRVIQVQPDFVLGCPGCRCIVGLCTRELSLGDQKFAGGLGHALALLLQQSKQQVVRC